MVPRPHPITLVAEAPGNYTLAWEQKAGTPVDNYTLFWCQHTRDRPYQCEVRLPPTPVRTESLTCTCTAPAGRTAASRRPPIAAGLLCFVPSQAHTFISVARHVTACIFSLESDRVLSDLLCTVKLAG